jgi:tetratricopeptide (TPR) repeat protein
MLTKFWFTFNAMNNLYRIALGTCLFIALLSPRSFAQETKTAKQLINEGVKLHDDGEYEQAIAKYKDALQVEPNNDVAEFEIGLSLYKWDKLKDAIPHLERVIKLRTKDRAEAYEMLGTIYDDLGQPAKAITYYQTGIKDDPAFSRLHFNLGITYFQQKQYAEAEKCAVTAIKLNAKHASSHKLYAESAFIQGKKLNALMAYTYFLMLEPNTGRSAKAYTTIDSIFKSSTAKNIVVTTNNGISPMFIAETTINMAGSAAAELKKKGVSKQADLLEFELKMVFNAAGKASAQQKIPKDFICGYADYFYKLAQSDHMPAFTNYISLKQGDESLNWFKDNDAALKAFAAWADENPIKF